MAISYRCALGLEGHWGQGLLDSTLVPSSVKGLKSSSVTTRVVTIVGARYFRNFADAGSGLKLDLVSGTAVVIGFSYWSFERTNFQHEQGIDETFPRRLYFDGTLRIIVSRVCCGA